MVYEAPDERSDYYTCPHCDTLTAQGKISFYIKSPRFNTDNTEYAATGDVVMRRCERCEEPCLWYLDILVYPSTIDSTVALASLDLPEGIRADVHEARSILHLSPRASSALLRLALEKLCKHLEAQGKDLNQMIGWLVANKGLSLIVQQTLDVVRVVGNEAVHPGILDQRDSAKDAAAMFTMLNEVVEELITKPKRVQALYDDLPEGMRAAIDRRNAKASEDAVNSKSGLIRATGNRQ